MYCADFRGNNCNFTTHHFLALAGVLFCYLYLYYLQEYNRNRLSVSNSRKNGSQIVRDMTIHLQGILQSKTKSIKVSFRRLSGFFMQDTLF